MSTKPQTETLNEKLLKVAGFHKHDYKYGTRYKTYPLDGWATCKICRFWYEGEASPPPWSFPDGSNGFAPDFPSSLDACFNPDWGIVRKCYICGVEFRFYPGLLRCVITVEDEGGFTEYEGEVPNEPPYEKYNIEKSALAFCRAVEKAIKAEQTRQEG